MKKLVILRGLPGSGKSTYTRNHLISARICSTDLFFTTPSGEYFFNPALIGEAHGSCCRAVIDAMQSGVELIAVDNTAIHVSEVAPYMLIAQAYGYEAEIVTLSCDVHTSVHRNIHGVPAHVIEYMAGKIEAEEASFPPWWKHTRA